MRPHRRQPTRLPRPVPGILQARTLEWVAISFSSARKWKVKVKLLSRVRLLATPWPAAYQAPPSMGFSRQETWNGLPLPSLYDPTDVGNLISYSTAFPKSSFYIWNFSVLVLLKPNLEDFEHYLARRVKWVQLYRTLSILWHCLSLELEWKHLFQSHGH